MSVISEHLRNFLGLGPQWPVEIIVGHFFDFIFGRTVNSVGWVFPFIVVAIVLLFQLGLPAYLKKSEPLLKQIAILGGVIFWIVLFGGIYLVLPATQFYDIRALIMLAFLASAVGLAAQAFTSLFFAILFFVVFPPRGSRGLWVYLLICLSVSGFSARFFLALQTKFVVLEEMKSQETSEDRLAEIFKSYGHEKFMMKELAKRPDLPADIRQGLKIKWPESLDRLETPKPLRDRSTVADSKQSSVTPPTVSELPPKEVHKSLIVTTGLRNFDPVNDLDEVSQFEDKVILFAQSDGWPVGKHSFMFEVLDPTGKRYFSSREKNFQSEGQKTQVYQWFQFSDQRKFKPGSYTVKAYVNHEFWQEVFLEVNNRVVTFGSGHYIVELKDVPAHEPVLSNLIVSTSANSTTNSPDNEWVDLSPKTREFKAYTVWSRLKPNTSYKYEIVLLDPQERVINRGELKMKTSASRWGFWTNHRLPKKVNPGDQYKLRVTLNGRLWATRPIKISESAVAYVAPSFFESIPSTSTTTVSTAKKSLSEARATTTPKSKPKTMSTAKPQPESRVPATKNKKENKK